MPQPPSLTHRRHQLRGHRLHPIGGGGGWLLVYTAGHGVVVVAVGCPDQSICPGLSCVTALVVAPGCPPVSVVRRTDHRGPVQCLGDCPSFQDQAETPIEMLLESGLFLRFVLVGSRLHIYMHVANI